MSGGDDTPSALQGQAEIKVKYKDVTDLVETMNKLATSIEKVHTALTSLGDNKTKTAIDRLKGLFNGKGGSAGGAVATGGQIGGGYSFNQPAGQVAPAAGAQPVAQPGTPGNATPQVPNGGFGISSRWRAAATVLGGVGVLGAAYANKEQGDLTSDVIAMRSVYAADQPKFSNHDFELQEATRLTARQFGGGALGREDMLAGAATLMGRYGTTGSADQAAAARGANVFAASSMQGVGFGAEMYNAMNDPVVLNRLRMFGGPMMSQVKNVTGTTSEMSRIAFGSKTPTAEVLANFRPGMPQYSNLMMMTGGNEVLATQMVEQMRMKQAYEAQGSQQGPWNDKRLRDVMSSGKMQEQLLGEKSLFWSKQQLEAGKALGAEESLALGRSPLVETNEALLLILDETKGVRAHVAVIANTIGNFVNQATGGAGGDILSKGLDIATIAALAKSGGGKGVVARTASRVAGSTAGRWGMQAAGKLALPVGLALAGAGAMTGGKEGDLSEHGFWGFMGGKDRKVFGMDKGTFKDEGNLAWSGIKDAFNIVNHGQGAWDELSGLFGGDPPDTPGWGSRDVGDPVSDAQAGGGMTVSSAEALLKSRGGHVQGVAGLASDFKVKLARLFAMNPKLSLSSGARSRAEQERLYKRWINRVPGQAQAAPPGKSNHEFGLAADIGPSSEYGWLAANAPGVGLVKPMDFEPWHWEPPGAKARRGGAAVSDAAAADPGAAGAVAVAAVLASQVQRVSSLNPSLQPGKPAALSGTAGGGMAVGAAAGGATSGAGGGGGGPAGGIGVNAAARAARAAGVPEDQVAMAVAIAMAESGLNPQAHNPVPPDDSYGLWQINMIGGMGPDRRASLGLKSNSELFDPNTNARAMAQISGGGHNWGPWSTYGSGAYKSHMSTVQAALSTGVGDPVSEAPQGPSMTPMPMRVSGGGGGGGVQILAPIHLSIREATDAEAERFARKVKEHLTGIVNDIDRARDGV